MFSTSEKESTQIATNTIIWLLGVFSFVLMLPGVSHAQELPIQMDSVSVNADNSIIIGWTLSPSITGGYVEIHRRLDSGLYGVITRVPVPRNFYVDYGVSADAKAFSYYIVLYDSNEVLVGRSDNPAHETIFLQPPLPDICARVIALNWSNYAISTTVGQPIPQPGFFTQNVIAVSVNDDDYQEIETLAPTSDRIVISTPVEGRYCIFMRSVDPSSGITSTSNIRCLDINFPAQQQFLYIRSVSINETTGAAEIEIYSDTDVPNGALMVEKFNPVTSDFVQLQTIVPREQDIIYTDPAALSGERSETYQVTLLDSCGHVSLVSPPHSSIFLTAGKVSSNINRLDWTPYIGWDMGVESYVIQRQWANVGGFEDIAVLSPDILHFVDDQALSGANATHALYRIVAREAAGNPFRFSGEALSNQALVERDVEVFIPNAFNPHSDIEINRIFKPLFSSATPLHYTLSVFNRWGQRIFHTNQLMVGWDGTYAGTAVPAGVYSYVISFVDTSGEEVEKRGAVLLVRYE